MYGEEACRSKFFPRTPLPKFLIAGVPPSGFPAGDFCVCLPSLFPVPWRRPRKDGGRTAERQASTEAGGSAPSAVLRMLSLYRAFSHGKCSADCASRRPPRRHKRNLFALLSAEASVSFSFDFVQSQSESALRFNSCSDTAPWRGPRFPRRVCRPPGGLRPEPCPPESKNV